jgi:hypothetical protein
VASGAIGGYISGFYVKDDYGYVLFEKCARGAVAASENMIK